MGYRHISNLYKNRSILMFKECYALEKIHGTSAHVKYSHQTKELTFFVGGAKYEAFINLFDHAALLKAFSDNCEEHAVNQLTVYGEAYGGKIQGMRKVYGDQLRFVAFEVLVGDTVVAPDGLIDKQYWQYVPVAEKIATGLGFEFVHYDKIETTEEAIDAAMNADSIQAIRNGMGEGHMREGVVLRAPEELIYQNGGRIICKHKRPEFSEREHTPKFTDPEKLKVLEEAKAIANEWVTPMRLQHVLDKFQDPQMEDAQRLIKAMVEDVEREAVGEIVNSKAARKAIGKRTMELFKTFLKDGIFTYAEPEK